MRLKRKDYFPKSLDKLTDIIIHDIFSPPVASRVYVYPCIAAYETLQQSDEKQLPLAGQLDGLTNIPAYEGEQDISLKLAALAAFMKTGTKPYFF